MEKILRSALIFLAATLIPVLVLAASSESYTIDHDSLNIGGGTSESESYQLNSTGGEVATGPSESESYNINAGYQAMNGDVLIVSFSGDASLSPGIVLPTGGRSDAIVTWTVTSNTGYSLAVKNNFNNTGGYDPLTSPGGGGSISDYVPASRVKDDGANYSSIFDARYILDQGPLDYDWSGVTAFGFSATSSHLSYAYKSNGATCGTGSTIDVTHCWDSFRPIPTNGVCVNPADDWNLYLSDGDEERPSFLDYPPYDTAAACTASNLVHQNEFTKRTIASTTNSVTNSITTLDLRAQVSEADGPHQAAGVYSMSLSASINAF